MEKIFFEPLNLNPDGSGWKNKKTGIAYSKAMWCEPSRLHTLGVTTDIHCRLKCFDNKNVIVDPWMLTKFGSQR
jgi:hypothetical protein